MLCSCMPTRGKKYQKELASRNALETDKLDLMAEISQLKSRLTTSERERRDLATKVDELHARLNERALEVAQLRVRLVHGQPGQTGQPVSRSNSLTRNGSLPGSPTADSFSRTLEREKTLDRLKRQHIEVERLKQAVETLASSNDEKDKQLEKLNQLLRSYRNKDELDLSFRVGHLWQDNSLRGSAAEAAANESPGDKSFASFMRVERECGKSHRSDSLGEVNIKCSPKTPPCGQHRRLGYGTLPVEAVTGKPPSPRKSPGSTLPASYRASRLGLSSFGRGILRLRRPSKWSSSSPDIAQAEAADEALKDAMAQEYKAMQNSPASLSTKKLPTGGFKKLFGRLRRANSQELCTQNDEFKRNGLRATVGPRFGWTRDLINTDLPFEQWDAEQVSAWLYSMGLSMYTGDCKRWLKNGKKLLGANANDLEKEMNVKNHFHRKKILLALKSVNKPDVKNGDYLDHLWVTRWLDDIGLPQYKDQFLDARLDGRMLNSLTVDELLSLRVSNTLHHLSIKQSIHVLRLHAFNPLCLKRRPVPEQQSEEVWLWTNHRVMEWLRTIDLSEYAPNLRGSGVHGALMVLEPRFGAEIFASILSIPSSKTLLRRHLSTHFVALIGSKMQAKKRELEGQPNFVVLTPNQKVKLRKLRLFSRGRSDSEREDFICPNDSDNPADYFIQESAGIEINQTNNLSAVKDGSFNARCENLSSKNYDEEMSTLTELLAQDEFLDQMPTSNV